MDSVRKTLEGLYPCQSEREVFEPVLAVFDAAMAYCKSLETNAPCGERDDLFGAMLDACKKAEEVERG